MAPRGVTYASSEGGADQIYPTGHEEPLHASRALVHNGSPGTTQARAHHRGGGWLGLRPNGVRMAWLPSIRPLGGTLSLVLASKLALDIRRFSIAEGISALFVVTLEAFSTDPALGFDDVVGQRARFTIQRGSEERSWSGIVRSTRLVQVEEDGLSTYEVVLVPDLWLLTQRCNRRNLQHLSEVEIAERLFEEWRIPHELRLSETYKAREYRTQYDESDHAFLCRMLEHAGVSYFFVEKDGETKVVLSDGPQRSEPRSTRLPFKADVTMVTGEYVTRAQAGRELRPGRVALRDLDHRLPAGYPLQATADGRALPIEARLEHFHATPGAFLYRTTQGGGTPVADDRGIYRSDERTAAKLAQKRLEANRGSGTAISFETNVLDLAPGVVVHVVGHPRPESRVGKLLVVESYIAGTRWGVVAPLRGPQRGKPVPPEGRDAAAEGERRRERYRRRPGR